VERGVATVNFRVESTQLRGDAALVALAGEVDLYTAPELKRELLQVIEAGAKTVIVDLTDTTFVDSTTLGVLLGGLKRLRANDGRIILVCSDRNIRKIFEITLLDRVFPIVETRDEALRMLDEPAEPS
jgi:anti-sigma B factor antagonist